MTGTGASGWKGRGLALVVCAFTGACADKSSDPSRPSSSGQQSLQQRLSGGGGYKQNEDGQWVVQSDKRSSFERQRESSYFKGDVDKKTYNTREYSGKKSWWGNKDYATKEYGQTSESRFQGAKARQDGLTARDDGKSARESGVFETNSHRLNGKSARESGSSEVAHPLDAEVESRRRVYQAPSVIDWKAQRSMSMEQSKRLLGR